MLLLYNLSDRLIDAGSCGAFIVPKAKKKPYSLGGLEILL